MRAQCRIAFGSRRRAPLARSAPLSTTIAAFATVTPAELLAAAHAALAAAEPPP